MSDKITCSKCKKEVPRTTDQNAPTWYRVVYGNAVVLCSENYFCSRSCMLEFFAPELKQAVVIKQWIPTPEDEERMSQ